MEIDTLYGSFAQASVFLSETSFDRQYYCSRVITQGCFCYRNFPLRRVLEVIDTLLRLSGSRKLYSNVMNLFHKPLSACPDVLLLGLLQIQVMHCHCSVFLNIVHSIIQLN